MMDVGVEWTDFVFITHKIWFEIWLTGSMDK